EAQVLGLAAGLSAVGIRAEMGGSAISRTMIEIANAVETGTEELALFAQVAGMTVEEFSRLFREDAAEAVIAFIEGLGTVRAEGENLFLLLEELGPDEIRARDLLLRAAGAGDLLRQSVQLGNQAWGENTALTQEAERRYATVESRLQMLRSTVSEAGVALYDAFRPEIIGIIDGAQSKIEGLVSALERASKASIGFGIGFAAAVAAAGPLLVTVGGLVSLLGGPLTLAITGVAVVAGALVGGFVALRSSLDDIRGRSEATAAALSRGWGDVRGVFTALSAVFPVVVAGAAAAAQAVMGIARAITSVAHGVVAAANLIVAGVEWARHRIAGNAEAASE